MPRGPGCAPSSESFLTALWTLFGRDPRRYGGYIVHVSMMLMAIGILGITFFQMETQATLVGERLAQAGRLHGALRFHRAVQGTGQPAGHPRRGGRLRSAGQLPGRAATPASTITRMPSRTDHPGRIRDAPGRSLRPADRLAACHRNGRDLQGVRQSPGELAVDRLTGLPGRHPHRCLAEPEAQAGAGRSARPSDAERSQASAAD